MTNELSENALHNTPMAWGFSPDMIANVKIDGSNPEMKPCNCMENCPFCSDEEVVQCDLGDTTCEACN